MNPAMSNSYMATESLLSISVAYKYLRCPSWESGMGFSFAVTVAIRYANISEGIRELMCCLGNVY